MNSSISCGGCVGSVSYYLIPGDDSNGGSPVGGALSRHFACLVVSVCACNCEKGVSFDKVSCKTENETSFNRQQEMMRMFMKTGYGAKIAKACEMERLRIKGLRKQDHERLCKCKFTAMIQKHKYSLYGN